uniref:Uncharacterized protein n=1 Tax=viral metagenome TaxID=1070528 RepID=A0A6C0KND9_9ZZZZ
MDDIITIINSIELFSDCEKKDTHHGPTICFKYNNSIQVKIYKNIDDFGGKKDKMSCSLSVFNPSIRIKIYNKMEEIPNLVDMFKHELNISI